MSILMLLGITATSYVLSAAMSTESKTVYFVALALIVLLFVIL